MQTRSLIQAAAMGVLALSALTPGLAQEKKVDPTGTWTWSVTGQNGESRTATLKLKLDGDKLTGTISGRAGGDSSIEEAKLKGDEIAFQTVRERDGNRFVTKYNGKISGDTIQGKSEFRRGDGETRTRDWEAKRTGGKPAANVTGNWKYTFTTSGGQTFEPTLKLQQEGDKVTGAVVMNQNEAPISDGQIKDGEISFKLIRERDGQTFTSKYAGKLDGDTIKGKISSNRGGTDRTYDFEAKRVKQ